MLNEQCIYVNWSGLIFSKYERLCCVFPTNVNVCRKRIGNCLRCTSANICTERKPGTTNPSNDS